MFEGERNPILDPIRIKRMINGKLLTFDVIETSYDRETNLVLLFEEESCDLYEAKFIDRQFIDIVKLEVLKG